MLKRSRLKAAISLFFVLTCVTAYAGESSSPENPSLRSAPGQFWVGIDGGLGAAGWGYNTYIGFDLLGDVNLAYRFKRVGVLALWRHEYIVYSDPGHSDNSVLAAGPFYEVWHFGRSYSASLMVYALLAHGQSTFTIQNRRHENLKSGTVAAGGFIVGAGFNFPLWLGLWAYAALDAESIGYNYPGLSDPEVQRTDNNPGSLQTHVGVRYSF